MKRINLDYDYIPEVKEETVIYELTNKAIYRAYFGFVILQFIFWAFCANILFVFYAGADFKGKQLPNLPKDEDISTTRSWIQNIYGKYFYLFSI